MNKALVFAIIFLSSFNVFGFERSKASRIPSPNYAEEELNVTAMLYGQGLLSGGDRGKGAGGLSVRSLGEKHGFEIDCAFGSMQKVGLSYLSFPSTQLRSFYFGVGPGYLSESPSPVVNGFLGFQFPSDHFSNQRLAGFIDGGLTVGVEDMWMGIPYLDVFPTIRCGMGIHF